MYNRKMENNKVEIIKTEKYGKAVFAKAKIKKGEFIGAFNGKIYEAERAMLLPDVPPLRAGRHAVQFEPKKWRDGKVKGLARYIAHSCNPNCGIKNMFEVVAMKDIKKGEEITWDYAMTENSDFRMKCMCGAKSCRKIIGAYSMLSPKVRKKYKGYISEWLTQKQK